MCMSIGFFFSFCIWLVAIICGYLIIKRVLPELLAMLGTPGGMLADIIRIVLWGLLMILILYIAWDLVECLVGPGGLRMPSLPRR